MEKVVIVDENDNVLGTEEKISAHENGGKLHRAISVFVFRENGDMLLQKRAKSKYHCGGLWTNTCCTHPREGESYEQAAGRRLQEEMGFQCPLKEEFHFIYKAALDHELTEHELDHVFTGQYAGNITPNPEEADGYDWISVQDLQKNIQEEPDKYTPWFKIALKELLTRGQ